MCLTMCWPEGIKAIIKGNRDSVWRMPACADIVNMLFYENIYNSPCLKIVFCYEGKYATFSCESPVHWFSTLAERTELTFVPRIKSQIHEPLQMRTYGSLLEISLLFLEMGVDISSSSKLSKHLLSLNDFTGLEFTGSEASDLMCCTCSSEWGESNISNKQEWASIIHAALHYKGPSSGKKMYYKINKLIEYILEWYICV